MFKKIELIKATHFYFKFQKLPFKFFDIQMAGYKAIKGNLVNVTFTLQIVKSLFVFKITYV